MAHPWADTQQEEVGRTLFAMLPLLPLAFCPHFPKPSTRCRCSLCWPAKSRFWLSDRSTTHLESHSPGGSVVRSRNLTISSKSVSDSVRCRRHREEFPSTFKPHREDAP